MVSPESQQQLNDLIQNHGRNAVNDPASLEASLREAIGDNTRDANLLIQALQAGVPQAIVAGSTDGAALAKKLQDENFLAADAAQSAVQSWATALGTTVSFDAPAADVVEAAAPFAAPPVSEPPPAVPVSPAPQAVPIAPMPQPAYSQPAQKSNVGMIVGIIAVVVVVGCGGIGYFIWNQAQEAVKSINTSTTGISTTTGTTGRTDSTPSDSASLDMDSYNVKLSAAQQEINEANEKFKKANQDVIAAAGQGFKLDQLAPIYDDFSKSIDSSASNLSTVTPPAEAKAIHDKFVDNARQLGILVADVAVAARSNDQANFTSSATKIKDFGTKVGTELSTMIEAAGFDSGIFAEQGKLIKKK